MSDPLSRTDDPASIPATSRVGTLDRILDSARILAIRLGFANLTVRDAAAAAGVRASSASVYFGSDAQLISEMLWRELISVPTTRSAPRRTKSRARADLRADALGFLGLRSRTARKVQRRLHDALGSRPDPHRVEQLEALYTAALFDAGAGYAAHSRGTRAARSPEQIILRILERH